MSKYPKEFKIEAVRLLNEDTRSIAEIARELGIKRTVLYRWRDELNKKGDQAFKKAGRPKLDQMSEISQLKKELRDVTEERDILKKAAAYFAKDLK
jgi:transposase